MNKIIFITLQVVVALVIIRVVNSMSTLLLEKDNVIIDTTKNVVSPIFVGWIDTNSFTNKSFNTHNQFARNYVNLPHSVNKMGGSQFSYTVWIKLTDVSAQNTADKVLFIQGDAKQYVYQTKETKRTGFGPEKASKNNYGYVVKSPMVKFGDDAGDLIVEFNTSVDFNARAEIKRVPSQDLSVRHNVFSLIPGNWAMMTFVFEDDKLYSNPEDGIKFTFYLNDTLYHTQRFKGALRLNNGDLTLLPSGPIQGGYLSDLTYYNHALGVDEISKVYTRGMVQEAFNTLKTDPSFNLPLALSQYNKLEINNA